MLRRLALRDVVIVSELELEFGDGFHVLTGETGAGKSILIDALQLALGGRGDAAVVREGAARAEVAAEFDTPASLHGWLVEAGFAEIDSASAAEPLLLRRSIDAQGRSRAWINGRAATVAQLRDAAESLVEIHGQHAWQSLTRPAAVRALLDAQAGVEPAPLLAAWQRWQAAQAALAQARQQQATLSQEQERLAWQIGELDKLRPGDGEWEPLNAEHQRLAHAQSLIDGVRAALELLAEGEDGTSRSRLLQALNSLAEVQRHDEATLAPMAETLRSAQALIDDVAHGLAAYLARAEPDPARLAQLDERLAQWVALARRYRRPAGELHGLLAEWKLALAQLNAATDLAALEQACAESETAWRTLARQAGAARAQAAPRLARQIMAAMQKLGMAGGSFDIALPALTQPQALGLEAVEFRVAGHAGTTPRPLAKVASGGELSRLALAIAVTTSRRVAGEAAATLIFDEIDAGVGGTVADSVGRLMKQLGREAQVLAVTHLPQVAACADRHFVVAKASRGSGAKAQTTSQVLAVDGEARVAEVARMLGGGTLSGTAHAQALLGQGLPPAGPVNPDTRAR
ncbi:MAG: DNA repair protein RecN [Rubrivivax sp.]